MLSIYDYYLEIERGKDDKKGGRLKLYYSVDVYHYAEYTHIHWLWVE